MRYDKKFQNKGPYHVMVEAKDKNVGNYHHLSVAKNILELKFDSVMKFERKGINRICVEFENLEKANEFVGNKTLIEKGYNLFIPNHLISCRGVVKYVDKNITETDLKDLTCVGNTSILNCKRMKHRQVNSATKEVNLVETGTVLYTFAGKILPRFVEIYGVPMQVEPYVIPVVQCYGCLLFGHTKKQCRGKLRCQTCSKILLEGHTCNNSIKCLHCGSEEHKSTSRQCREYSRQTQIRQLMCFENLSFQEANSRLPKPKNQKGYFPREREFPPLRRLAAEEPVGDVITVEERKNHTLNKRAYATAIQAPQKRLKQAPKPGYDRAAHNACIVNPTYSKKSNGSQIRQSQTQNNHQINKTQIRDQKNIVIDEDNSESVESDSNAILEFREILRSLNNLDHSKKRLCIETMSKILNANLSQNEESDTESDVEMSSY